MNPGEDEKNPADHGRQGFENPLMFYCAGIIPLLRA
jgi:hypothetical protein